MPNKKDECVYWADVHTHHGRYLATLSEVTKLVQLLKKENKVDVMVLAQQAKAIEETINAIKSLKVDGLPAHDVRVDSQRFMEYYNIFISVNEQIEKLGSVTNILMCEHDKEDGV